MASAQVPTRSKSKFSLEENNIILGFILSLKFFQMQCLALHYKTQPTKRKAIAVIKRKKHYDRSKPTEGPILEISDVDFKITMINMLMRLNAKL